MHEKVLLFRTLTPVFSFYASNGVDAMFVLRSSFRVLAEKELQMNWRVMFGGMAATLLLPLHAADDLGSMFSEGTASGQIRFFYLDRDYSGYTGAPHRNATALGGHLKFETADYNGISVGAAAYTTNRIFQGLEYGDSSEGKVDPALFGYGYKSYTIFGEAYLKVKYGASAFTAGRQKLNTPMAAADDARMLPSLFEAYVFSNKDLEKTTLIAAHVTKFAPGSFSNVYASGGILAATSGYSPLPQSYADYSGDFANMGSWAVGEETGGVSLLAGIYKDEHFTLQAWDYYGWDILNALYLEGTATWNCRFNDAVKPFVGVQLIKEDDVGDAYLANLGGDGEIDSLYWGVKAGAKYRGLSAYVAYSQSGANESGDAAYAHAVISPWGGMPAYTQGMVTRHQFMAGTKAWKAAASYSFMEQGVNLSTALYYAVFDMDEHNGYSANHSWTANEPGFDIQYYPAAVKNLQLRLRGNFPDKFYESDTKTVSWNEYRFIVNYNF